MKPIHPGTPLKGLLFDKDGTLFDYALSWSRINVAAATLAACGDKQLAKRSLEAGGANPQTGLARADTVLAAGTAAEIAEAFSNAGSPIALTELAQQIDQLFVDSATEMVPVTDTALLFARLKQRGLKLGIASSDNEAAIHRSARHFGFDQHLDFVAGYDSGHGVKPGPGMVHGFCAATGLEPGSIAVIGDNLHDMHMGHSAGAAWLVGVLTGTGTRATLEPAAHVVIDSIEGLEACLFGE